MTLREAVLRGRELAREGHRQIFVYQDKPNSFWVWHKQKGPAEKLCAICMPGGAVKMSDGIRRIEQ